VCTVQLALLAAFIGGTLTCLHRDTMADRSAREEYAPRIRYRYCN
jgi:hypothetical protein